MIVRPLHNDCGATADIQPTISQVLDSLIFMYARSRCGARHRFPKGAQFVIDRFISSKPYSFRQFLLCGRLADALVQKSGSSAASRMDARPGGPFKASVRPRKVSLSGGRRKALSECRTGDSR